MSFRCLHSKTSCVFNFHKFFRNPRLCSCDNQHHLCPSKISQLSPLIPELALTNAKTLGSLIKFESGPCDKLTSDL